MPKYSPALAAVVSTFQSFLYLPDPCALIVALAAAVANLLVGDAVWLLLIGPPSSGKTEIVSSLRYLPDTRFVSTLSGPSALLSGTSKKEIAHGAKGGLLMEIGAFGILLIKDFGSILALRSETRSDVLAALREVYDGRWDRPVGSDGGHTLHWEGKVGLVSGATEEYDRAHAAIAVLGERFALCRVPSADPLKQSLQALETIGHERELRERLAVEIRDFVNMCVTLPEHPDPPDPIESQRLSSLASLAARCRSAVEHDPRTRELLYAPEAEAPARLVRCFALLLASFKLVGVVLPEERWRLLVKVALDCMPGIRRKVFDVIASHRGVQAVTVENQANMPETTVLRSLEDLQALGIVTSETIEEGDDPEKPEKNVYWELSKWAREQLTIAQGEE